MATKKDLVEAHSFSKRRLVTAFISGAPGGREVEPVRPGRVLIGGVALSLLLLAGAAVAGFLVGRPDSQWLEAGSFVTSKDTGEQYVVLEGGDDPVIRRVPNYISAQLLLGQADLTPFQVRDKYIREVTLGEDLGIDDAPAGLPDPDRLIQDGWTACTSPDAGIQVALNPEPEVEELVDSAFLVRSDKVLWLIATDSGGAAYRFQLPADPSDAGTIANRLRLGATEDAPDVSFAWLNLFWLGDPLTADEFGVRNLGQPTNYSSEVETDLSDYRIGDLVTTPGGDYLLGDEGPEELSEFASLVYDAVGPATHTVDERIAAAFPSADYSSLWPATLPTPSLDEEMCAVLHPGSDGDTRVTLAHAPTGDASPDGLGVDRRDVEVQPAGGAYVQSGADAGGSTDGTLYVIDSTGYKYELIGADVPTYIGYGSTAAPLVPSSWLDFFEDKVQLSTNAARRVSEDAPAADSTTGES